MTEQIGLMSVKSILCQSGKETLDCLTRLRSLSVLVACTHRCGTLPTRPFWVRDFQSNGGSLASNALRRSPEARWSFMSLSSEASMWACGPRIFGH